MKVPFKERALSAAVVVPAAVIVIVLAVLQYNWSNQVSEATSLRLADSLQMSMVNWHLDFFRVFSQICLNRGRSGRRSAPGYSGAGALVCGMEGRRRLSGLGFGLLHTASGKALHPSVLRYDAATKRLEPASQPPELAGLQEKLQAAFVDRSRRFESRKKPALAGASAIRGGLLSGRAVDWMAV